MTIKRVSYELANDFDINQLRSYIAVLSKSTSTVEIVHSHFIGGYSAVHVTSGTLIVSNSTFKSMTVSVLADFLDSVQITECAFTFVGELHGPLIGLGEYGAVGVVDISDSQNASLSNSVFSSYTPGGLVAWNEVQNVIMNGNQFVIDIDGYLTDLYGVNAASIMFNWQWVAVAFQSCDNAEIIGNVFSNNDVQPEKPWIYIDANTETCFSANKLSGCCMMTCCCALSSKIKSLPSSP